MFLGYCTRTISLTLCVQEVLTGKVPYHWANERQVLKLVLVKKELPPRPDGIPDAVWELLNFCWAQVPSGRPSIKQVEDRLEVLFPPPVG